MHLHLRYAALRSVISKVEKDTCQCVSLLACCNTYNPVHKCNIANMYCTNINYDVHTQTTYLYLIMSGRARDSQYIIVSSFHYIAIV